ncbi:GNAT family N-acetyltransferase [Microvirga roseola]|uniref:GNAT family N-acetyltransferase n=1 Tax=Microvirga roseola TaxID=2883126 RepID=UPI001E298963|nr:GNAT family N-acetyltransferase [Microvirga roseola]
MTVPSPILAFVGEPDDELHRVVLEGIRTFNQTVLLSSQPAGQDLAIAIRDPECQAPVGGLLGRTAGGWRAIELVFVPETLRGSGLATRLIAMAEDEARRRGCHAAWLDTLNPKALGLYQRLGYEVFGELKDYPVGSSRFFLQKKLGPAPSA